MKFKSQLYGLSKKIKNARNNGFIFKEIVKLRIKIDSSQSNKKMLISKTSNTDNAPTFFKNNFSKS